VIAFFFLPPVWGGWAIWGLFLFAGITDFFDGWLARRSGQGTAFGAMLDQIADKLLVATVLVLLAAAGWLDVGGIIAAVVIILREIFISGLREFAAGHTGTFPVSKLAKWKTTVQIAALVTILLSFALGDRGLLWQAGEGLLMLAAALTAWTGWVYWRAAQRRGMFRQ
jgi:CDP-diacylglycerol--glycerol-3-phosphate 3-phosphatidyltransferase